MATGKLSTQSLDYLDTKKAETLEMLESVSPAMESVMPKVDKKEIAEHAMKKKGKKIVMGEEVDDLDGVQIKSEEEMKALIDTIGEDSDRKRHFEAIASLSQLINYFLYLGFIGMIVFYNQDNDVAYKATHTLDQQLLEVELDLNVYFADIMSVGQAYQWLDVVFLPTAYKNEFYNGKLFGLNGGDTANYQGFYLNEVQMTLGKTRLRQIRSTDTCVVPSAFRYRGPTYDDSPNLGSGEAFGTDRSAISDILDLGVRTEPDEAEDGSGIMRCFPGYDDAFNEMCGHCPTIDGPCPLSQDYVTSQSYASDLKASFLQNCPILEPDTSPNATDVPLWRYKYWSDGPGWSSTSSGVSYPPGGYIEDLPLGIAPAQERLQELIAMGWIDEYTRALFVDVTFYSAQVDIFVHGKFVFEFLPTGAVIPSAQIEAQNLIGELRAVKWITKLWGSPGDTVGGMPGSEFTRFITFVFEIVLYLIVFQYLCNASDEIVKAGSFKNFCKDIFNLMDVGNLTLFLMVMVFRFGFMVQASTLDYQVYWNKPFIDSLYGYKFYELQEPDDTGYDEYFRIEFLGNMYRRMKDLFALGVLVNFGKVFKYLAASEHLGQFTATIMKASIMLPPIVVVTMLLMVGFGFAFFITLGPYLAEYKTFEDTMYTMLLVIFEDFDVLAILDYSSFTFMLGNTAISIPVGLLIFCLFACLTVFVMLMMLLKMVDDAYMEVLEEAEANTDSFAKDLQDAFIFSLSTAYLSYKQFWISRNAQRLVKMGKIDVAKVLEKSGLGLKMNAQLKKHRSKKNSKKNGGGEDDVVEEVKPKELSLVDRELEKLIRKRRGKLTVNDLQTSRRVIVKQLVRQGKMDRLAEHDIEHQDIQDRIDMLKHRQQILVKMTGRMLNSIESLMITVHDVDDSYDMESKVNDGIMVNPSSSSSSSSPSEEDAMAIAVDGNTRKGKKKKGPKPVPVRRKLEEHGLTGDMVSDMDAPTADNEEGDVRFPTVGPDVNNLDLHLAGAHLAGAHLAGAHLAGAVVEDEPEMVHLLTTAATDGGSVGGGSAASANGKGDGGADDRW